MENVSNTSKPTKEETHTFLVSGLLALKDRKPNDRSELDRRYAIAITEMEKLLAFIDVYLDLKPGITSVPPTAG